MKFIYFCLFLLFSACSFPTNEESNAVARVGENYLYPSDLQDQIGPMYNGDSLQIANRVIDDWAEQLLYLKKAEINLSSFEKKQLDELVKTYRNDLYVKTYKDKAIQSQLDSVVEQAEIQEYFEQNKVNFRTNKDLLRGRYVRVRNENYNLRTIRRGLRRFNDDDKIFLDSIALQFTTYSMNDSIWVQASQFFNRLPSISDRRYKNFLKNDTFFELQDSLEVYLVMVEEVVLRNDLAPLEYVTPTLKQILINKRKLELMRQFDREIIEEGLRQKTYEVYE
ncbi:MAG: peptidyl-prolyl cis-trans isomerase [Flavobacteriaceae bacterium]|nr:peptidyl-prolyl cis-trans isomerase [Flavobacteriaceae bacterium]